MGTCGVKLLYYNQQLSDSLIKLTVKTLTILYIFIACTFLWCCGGGGSGSTDQEPVIYVTGVSLSTDSATISVGGTMQLSAVISPTNATDTSVAWSSSDESVATVSSLGMVTALSPGTADVTVTTNDGNFYQGCTIDVNVAITGLSVTPKEINMSTNDTFQLIPTITPSNASNTNITWTSSDESIASVSMAGIVTANSVGETTITLTTVDGNFQDACKVFVGGTWFLPSDLSDNISPDGQIAYFPKVAMDQNGNAIVAWFQSDGSYRQVFISEYRNDRWHHPVDLNDNISISGEDAEDPQVAMAANGDAIVVWQQSDGSNDQIFLSEYRNGSWRHPTSLNDNISPDGSYAESPQVSMATNGDAIVVWQQSDGSNDQIFLSEYRNGSWRHPTSLDDNISPDGSPAREPQVSMTSDGNAIVVWQQGEGADYQIFKSEYNSGSWRHPTGLSDNISANGQSARYPQVSISENGDAVVVWQQWDGSNYQIFMSERRGGYWANPTDLNDNISPDCGNADDPQVAMDLRGNAKIVWSQSCSSPHNIYLSEYSNGHWQHPTDSNDYISEFYQSALHPKVTMDDFGNSFVIWQQNDGAKEQIYLSENKKGTWTHPAGLNDSLSPTDIGGYDPELVMNANGKAIVVWRRHDGMNTQIFMSEYR